MKARRRAAHRNVNEDYMNIVRKWQLTQMMSLPQMGGTQFIASVKMGGTQFIASETGRSGRIKMRPSRTPLPHLPFVNNQVK